jgi:hypothetical protein
MATYTWEFGAEGSGLHFTIVYDIATQKFTVTSLEGKFDLNALWWDNGTNDGSSPTLSKADNALNMNGSGATDWDGYAKLSNTGLGPAGENKTTFVEEGETWTFTLADLGVNPNGAFDPASGGTLGVRATSVNGGDSIKLVDTTPVLTPDPGNDPEPDHFPEWTSPGLSHVTFYFETGTNPYYDGDESGITGDKGLNDPDGWFTVKFDDNANLSDDLDDWFDDALAYIAAQNPDLDLSTLKGVSIKGGTSEVWYDLDNDPDDDDSANAPSVWIVENKEVDQAYNVIDDDPFTVA